MRKKLLVLSLSLCGIVYCQAQSAPSHVISAQGGHAQGNGYSLEWTLGETVAATSTTPAYIYTQGFNQSFVLSTGKKRSNDGNGSVTVFAAPNPVTANLTIAIETATPGKYAVVLTNLFGVSVYENRSHLNSNNLTIAMGGFANGAYLLRVYDANKKVINTTKIVKL